MAKKSGKSNDPEKRMAREDDPSFTESFAGDAMESVDDLLGKKALSGKGSVALVRINPARLNAEMLSELKLQRPSGMGPIIAGPYKLKDLDEWSTSGVIAKSDLVMTPFKRWLPASDYFVHFQKSEMTATQELTSSLTVTGSKTVEMDSEEEGTAVTRSVGGDDVVSLELEDGGTVLPAPSSERMPNKSSTQTIVAPSIFKAAKNESTAGAANPSKRSAAAWIVAAVFLAVLFFSVKSLVRKPVSDATPNDPTTVDTKVTSVQQQELIEDWPEWMKPLPTDTLANGDDDAMTRKLSKIIERVRLGSYQFADSEVQLLRKISSPATASWGARKLASNILAIWLGLQGKAGVGEAVEVLRPIYEASPDDLVTVLNLSMLSMENGDLAGADEIAQVGLRLCSQATCWFSNLLMANVKARLNQWANAEKYFQEAADDFADPVAVYGMWALGLSREEASKHAIKARALLDRALWGDPDRMVSSPLPDAVGFPLLYQRSFDDMKDFFSLPTWGLTSGQQEFLKWRYSLLSGKGSLGGAETVLAKLSNETSPLSQLLSVYLLSVAGNLDAARDRMSSILVLIKDTQPAQGWPWTLAGDLQNERGYSDQALIFYQGARQKFGEAAAMDAQYVLPKLRISRFEWLRRLRNK